MNVSSEKELFSTFIGNIEHLARVTCFFLALYECFGTGNHKRGVILTSWQCLSRSYRISGSTETHMSL